MVTVICAAVAIWLNWSSWFTSADRIDPGGIWFARAAGLLFIVAFVMVLRAVRYSIWLDDDRLVRQGALLRRRVAIRTATFQIKESTRFGSITAPTLVVRTSAISRIRLPLAQRTGHQAIGDRVIVAGLPPDEIGPLVDAIYRYATAPNQERIARDTSGPGPRHRQRHRRRRHRRLGRGRRKLLAWPSG